MDNQSPSDSEVEEELTPPSQSENSESADSACVSDTNPGPGCKKKRSVVFFHFDLKADGKYHCKYCKNSYKKDKTGSTSGLQRHLKNYHSSQLRDGDGGKSKSTLDYFFKTGKQQKKPFNKEEFVSALVDFIVLDNQPFSLSESLPFLTLLKSCNNDVELPCADTIRNHIQVKYQQEKLRLKELINVAGSKISFIIDCWTSRNQWPFQGVIATWINSDWELQEVIVDLSILKGEHTGKNLAESFANVISELNLWNKIGSITTDNASNMDTFFRHFKKICFSKGILFDEVNQRVRCLAHIMNLACKDAIKRMEMSVDEGTEEGTEDFSSSDEDGNPMNNQNQQQPGLFLLDKLRAGIRKIRSSPQRRESFRGQCQAAKINHKELIRDIDTRWNSTYNMIKRALELKLAYERTLRLDKALIKFQLSEEGWARLTLIVDLLKPFLDMTLQISTSNIPTISICGLIYVHLYQHLEKYIHDSKRPQSAIDPKTGEKYPTWLQEAAQAAYNKLDKYYPTSDGLAYVVATVLNPRCKLDWYKSVEFPKSFIKSYERALTKLWQNEYKPQPNMDTSNASETDKFEDLYSKQMKKRKTEPQDELELYLTSPASATPDGNKNGPFKWWKDRVADFPNLSQMAKDFLCISGSGVPVERLFSGGTDLLSQNRQSLSPETIRECMCLKGWLLSTKKTELRKLINEAVVHKITG